jgi:hypothetical protein
MLAALLPAFAAMADGERWASDPAVQEVLALRKLGIEAMTSDKISPESERYSSTFVANTPAGGVRRAGARGGECRKAHSPALH